MMHARTSRREVSHRPAADPRCGTTAGHSRHIRRGEHPCPDCCAAMAIPNRLQRLRRAGATDRLAAYREAVAYYSQPSSRRRPGASADIRELVEAVTGAGPADAVNVVYAQAA